LAGGAHHTCYSQNISAEQMEDFASMAGIEYICINNETSIYQLKNELRWNDKFYQ
jgi:L-arabinose isomerase